MKKPRVKQEELRLEPLDLDEIAQKAIDKFEKKTGITVTHDAEMLAEAAFEFFNGGNPNV